MFAVTTLWTRPHHCGHMWELAVPHLPSRIIDFQGLARDQFYTSSCSCFYGNLYFQMFMNARKVRRSCFPYVSCVIWPSPRGAQPIEDGPCAGAEGFVTRVADEALLLLRMDTDIAHARLASGRAVPIGAKYRRGIHAMLLLAVRGSVPRGVCQDPHFRYK